MRLVYMSPVPWASFSQRPHKFVEWFHRRSGEQVLWVDPYPTRLPMLADFKRLSPWRSNDKQRRIDSPAWLKVIKPMALPLEPLPGSAWLNSWMWNPVLDTIDDFAGTQSSLMVIGKPSALALAALKRVRSSYSVYDAMDDFPAFYQGLSRKVMVRHEKQLVRQTDAVWVSSSALNQRWREYRLDIQLVPNGFDATALPSETTKAYGRRTVFGYVGTIANWFDWRWLLALAEARPGAVIRLIGPLSQPAPKDLPENVEILPACNHETALKAMQDFDVGLIPFKRNRLTASVDPIKYYEYRALGMPVISTDFGEMSRRLDEEGTFISKRLDDITYLADAALHFKNCKSAISNFVQKNSWESRFDALTWPRERGSA